MHQKNKRQYRGQAISEFGPALMLLLVATFFPFVVLVSMGFSFGSVWWINNLLCKELSVNTQASQVTVTKRINTAFRRSGIAAFLGINNVQDPNQVNHTVVYRPATADGEPAVVSVTSVFTTRPPLVPGFNNGNRFSFTCTTEKMREVVD